MFEQLLQLLLVQLPAAGGRSVGRWRAIRAPSRAGHGGIYSSRPLAAMVDGQIERVVQVAFLTAARRFAAGAGPLDQAAAHERLLGNPLGELGTCVAFLGGTLAAVVHGVSSAALTMYYTLRIGRRRQAP